MTPGRQDVIWSGPMHNRPAMSMKKWSAITSLVLAVFCVALPAQPTPTEAHLAAAKAAAGADFAGVFGRICNEAVPQTASPVSRGGRGAAAAQRPAGPPPRETWHAEPVKV